MENFDYRSILLDAGSIVHCNNTNLTQTAKQSQYSELQKIGQAFNVFLRPQGILYCCIYTQRVQSWVACKMGGIPKKGGLSFPQVAPPFISTALFSPWWWQQSWASRVCFNFSFPGADMRLSALKGGDGGNKFDTNKRIQSLGTLVLPVCQTPKILPCAYVIGIEFCKWLILVAWCAKFLK